MTPSKLTKLNSIKRKIKKLDNTILGLGHLQHKDYLESMYPDINIFIQQEIQTCDNERKYLQKTFKKL